MNRVEAIVRTIFPPEKESQLPLIGRMILGHEIVNAYNRGKTSQDIWIAVLGVMLETLATGGVKKRQAVLIMGPSIVNLFQALFPDEKLNTGNFLDIVERCEL